MDIMKYIKLYESFDFEEVWEEEPPLSNDELEFYMYNRIYQPRKLILTIALYKHLNGKSEDLYLWDIDKRNNNIFCYTSLKSVINHDFIRKATDEEVDKFFSAYKLYKINELYNF